jgi:hypothetical protein
MGLKTWVRLRMRKDGGIRGRFAMRLSISGVCGRDIRSETAVDGEGRQYEYQGVDDGPNKRYPGGHFEVPCLIYASKSDCSQHIVHIAVSR